MGLLMTQWELIYGVIGVALVLVVLVCLLDL